ncbi:hypothetical protein [Pseudomonas neuropathica]|uniref:Uncharacterized protein n=1 Tax=Pseudomonas neuropathica TaxID=2730425 RepID=A0ACC7MU86_9PSED
MAGYYFYNNGIDSGDHSSLYAFTSGLNAHHNFFDHPTESSGLLAPCVAIESFGSGNQLCNNYVRNYVQFCWIGAGEDVDQHGPIVVSGNYGSVSHFGIALSSIPPQDNGLIDVLINDNNLRVTAVVITNPHLSATKCGLYWA